MKLEKTLNFLYLFKFRYESQPVESNINAQYNEEDVIPSAGHAKELKSKFLNFEKEAAKVETSSSKMNYTPKKFTSATSPLTNNSNGPSNNNANANKENINKSVKSQKPANNTSLLTAAPNQQAQANSLTDKCCVCDKIVYAMEKIEADKKVYHKLCFKCTSCNCTLK